MTSTPSDGASLVHLDAVSVGVSDDFVMVAENDVDTVSQVSVPLTDTRQALAHHQEARASDLQGIGSFGLGIPSRTSSGGVSAGKLRGSSVYVPTRHHKPPPARSQPKGKTVKRPELAELERWLNLANDDGSFQCSYSLQAATGITLRFVRAWAQEDWGSGLPHSLSRKQREASAKRCQPCKGVLATALMLVKLQERFSEHQVEWEPASRKAIAWLESVEDSWTGCVAATVAELLEVALQRLQLQKSLQFQRNGGRCSSCHDREGCEDESEWSESSTDAE